LVLVRLSEPPPVSVSLPLVSSLSVKLSPIVPVTLPEAQAVP